MEPPFDFAYCESAAGWIVSQPLNAASNLVFVALAWWTWNDPAARLHRFGLLAVALGSLVWHTAMQPWALILDVGAIVLWAALWALDWSRAVDVPWRRRAPWATLYLCVCVAVGWALLPVMPMWSAVFVPYAVGCTVLARSESTLPALRGWWALSAIAMAAAMFFRENDLRLCADVPVGVHWLWHLLTGISLLGPIRALSLTATVAPYLKKARS